jgi:hypothetical protein
MRVHTATDPSARHVDTLVSWMLVAMFLCPVAGFLLGAAVLGNGRAVGIVGILVSVVAFPVWVIVGFDLTWQVLTA